MKTRAAAGGFRWGGGLVGAVGGGGGGVNGAALDGWPWNASYIGVASASNSPSGFIPRISSIERITESKS